MWKLYYIKAGRRVESGARFSTETDARQAALDRAYHDGLLWKVRYVEVTA